MEDGEDVLGLETTDYFEHVARSVGAEYQDLRWLGSSEVVVGVEGVGDSVSDGIRGDAVLKGGGPYV